MSFSHIKLLDTGSQSSLSTETPREDGPITFVGIQKLDPGAQGDGNTNDTSKAALNLVCPLLCAPI